MLFRKHQRKRAHHHILVQDLAHNQAQVHVAHPDVKLASAHDHHHNTHQKRIK